MIIDHYNDYIFLSPIKVYPMEKDKNREPPLFNEILDESNDENEPINKENKKFRDMV